jgi:hypothetical protein
LERGEGDRPVLVAFKGEGRESVPVLFAMRFGVWHLQGETRLVRRKVQGRQGAILKSRETEREARTKKKTGGFS